MDMQRGMGKDSGESLRLRAFAAYLTDKHEQERKCLAREIHDELGQLLTAVKMDLFWLEEHIPKNNERMSKRLDDTIALINMTIGSLHEIVAQLRPSVLDDLGIIEAVRWQAREFQKQNSIPCSLDIQMEEVPLSSGAATATFRIFQDVLAGIARHTGTSQVYVRVSRTGNDFCLTVSDNGRKGISGDETFEIMAMQEQAARLHGSVDIGTADDGNIVHIKLPLHNTNNHHEVT